MKSIMPIKYIVLFGVCVVLAPLSIQPETAPDLQPLRDRVSKASPFDLYRTIDGAKVAAFSKDYLIREGLSEKDSKGWGDITQVSNEYVADAVKQETASKLYGEYVRTIGMAYSFLKDSIASLHDKYARFYVKPTGSAKVTLDLGKTRFDASQVGDLQHIATMAGKYQDFMRKINDTAFEAIMKNSPVPQSWMKQLYDSSGTIKDAADIMSNYKKFLANYKKEKDFNAFMQKNGVTDRKSAEATINALEQIIAVMQEKLKSDPKNKERQANVVLAQEVMEKIHERFPGIISTLQSYRLSASDDKVSMILFVESGALESVLNQFNREIAELISAGSTKPSNQKTK